MYRILTLSTFFTCVCNTGVIAAASVSNIAAKKAIQAQYDKGTKALKAEDADAYKAICTPDAIFTTPHKAPETLKEHLSHIGPNPDSESVVSSERQTIQRVRLNSSGHMATVDTEDVSLGTMAAPGGKLGPNNQPSKWSMVIHARDLWLKQKNIWQLKKSAIEPGSIFRLDGKVIPVGDGDLSP